MPPWPCAIPGPAPAPCPGALPRLAEAAALTVLALGVAGVMQLFVRGPADTSPGAGLIVLRLDAIGATVTLLVAFVGWVVVRYARSYLDGEPREGAFHGLLLATLAAGFVAVGAALRRLLLFYPARAGQGRGGQVRPGLGHGRCGANAPRSHGQCGAAGVVLPDIAALVAVDNGTTAPGQNAREHGVTIAMADQTGPFDFHLTRKLVDLCRADGIGHQKDIFRHYRSDSASALEAGADVRTALVTFGVDASHGHERIHIDALTALARLLALYAISPVEIPRDAHLLSGLHGFPEQTHP